MDGLLIDTEPVWRIAEQAVFAELGIELSQADLLDTTGVRVDELVRAFLPRRPPAPPVSSMSPASTASVTSPASATSPTSPTSRASPGPPGSTGPDPAEVADRIIDQVAAYVSREGVPMPGVRQAISLFQRSGLRLAIASSSPKRLIDVVCARLELDIEVRCSALDEPNGKPAPDVYLAAARRLQLSPACCLALEDSPAGVVAAKSAGMSCLAVPDPLLTGDPRYRRADLVLSSLTELDEPVLRRLGVRPAA
jgi:mannitol-1-/sugar-/sorbitol-6-/2-deoxyglucose-6-phosphatase